MRKREEVIGSLVASYHAYEDLLNKTTKGLEFYDKLDVNVSKLLARVGGVVKVQEEERTQQMTSSAQKAADARALSLSLISGGYKPEFTPGAPPPDTPSSSPAPPAPSGGGRPKLSDYLAARKSKTASPSNPPPPPGIRPQPVGSEADPPHSSSGAYTSIATPTSSLHQPSYHSNMAQPAFSTHPGTHSHQVHGQGYQVHNHKMQMPGQGIQGQQMPGQGIQGQQMPGQVMQGQQMPGQGIQGQQMPGQGLQGQQMPVQGKQGQQMHGQGMQGQQMPGQGIHGQQMPGQGMQGQQMPGHGPHIQQVFGKESHGQQMPGEPMHGYQWQHHQQGIQGPKVPGQQESPQVSGQGVQGQHLTE